MANMPKSMIPGSGSPISNSRNPLTAGPRGPMLMLDYAQIESMAHFVRVWVGASRRGWG